MTISTTTHRNVYAGSGITGPYAYTFRIFAATDLLVKTQNATTGTIATLSYPADYSVAGVGLGTGGSITLTVALASGYALSIQRVRPLTQDTEIRNQGAFFAETHEDAFDNAMMIDQQQQDDIDRSFKVDDAFTPGTVDATIANFLPNYYLQVKADGSGIQGVPSVVQVNPANLAIVNVKDPAYGAKGDGVTDDTAAIQAAIDILGTGGGIVYFPIGNYLFASTITISNQHIIFWGQTSVGNTGAAKGGWAGSILYYTGSGTGITVTQVSDHAGWGFTARDMGFRATPAAQRMIFDDNMLWGLLENCWADAGQNQGDDIAPPTSTATFLYSTSSVWTIRHCLISRWNIGVDFAGSVTAGCNSCLIDGGTEILDNNIGVRFGFVVTATGCTLRDAVIQDNVTANIQVYQAVACRVIDCYFEDGAPAPIGGPSTSIDIIGVSAVSDVDGFQVHGCYFAGNGFAQSSITLRRGQNISFRDNAQRGYKGTANLGFINNVGTAVASIYLENNHRVPFDGNAFPEISSMTGVVSAHSPTDLQQSGSLRRFGLGFFRIESTGGPPDIAGATGVGLEAYTAGGASTLRSITAPSTLAPINFFASKYSLTGAALSVYANNAAALVGGLTAGDLYMTATGQVMIVF